jgi:protein involved in polysaccharide export with SLBB domain
MSRGHVKERASCEKIAQWPVNVPTAPQRAVWSGTLAILLLSGGLTACEPARSYERAGDGSTVYLDQLSDAAKANTRQKIAQSLTRGADVFDLSVGDEIEIFFHINRKARPKEYVISVADKLSVEFLNDKDNSRTIQVRPDGRISLPLIGSVTATGQTIDALARQLEERYGKVLTAPAITVNVTEAHSQLDDFIEMIGQSSSGARSLINKVLPDGTISLPLLRPLKARGRTLKDLKNELDEAYAALGLDVTVSLVPRTLRTGTMFVLGEVSKPGRFDLERPRTVLMAVAQAGGALPTGAMNSVRLFYSGADGVQRVRSINLYDVMDDLRIEEDMIVPDNSVIYVPPTELAKAGRLMDAIVRDILRFNGFVIAGTYNLGGLIGNQTVVPSTSTGP